MSFRSISDVGIRRQEIRMVEGVENVRAELKLLALRYVEDLGKRGIELLLSIGVQWIDSRGAVGHRRRVNDEGAGIEPLVHGRVAQRPVSNAVRTIGLSIVERSGVIGRSRRSGLRCGYAAARRYCQPPRSVSTKRLALPRNALPRPKGSSARKLGIEDVGNILLRGAVVLIDVGHDRGC